MPFAKRIISSALATTLVSSAIVVGAGPLAAPASAATADLSTTFAADRGGDVYVSQAGIIATGGAGGACDGGATGGLGSQVSGLIALIETDTVIAYPGSKGGNCSPSQIGAGGTSADPVPAAGGYRGGDGGLPYNGGTSIGQSGAGGGAATSLYKNSSTQVALAGGGGGGGGNSLRDANQANGGTGGNAGNPASSGSIGGTNGGGTGGAGGAGGSIGWLVGQNATNATCSNTGGCGGPGGGGGGDGRRGSDGAATASQIVGGGGGGGGYSVAPGLSSVSYAAGSAGADGSASITYVDITAGDVDDAAESGTYTGTDFTADSGWATLTWDLDGTCTGCAIPAGLAIDGTSGEVSGTVTATAGTYTFEVLATATLGSGPLSGLQLVTRKSITMEVAPASAPTFTSGDSATATVGSAMTPFTVTTDGIPSATVSISSGSFPSGITFTPGPGGTATIEGTPAGGTAGSHTVTLQASNGVSPNATQQFTLTVAARPKQAQVPLDNCVTAGTPRSIPRRGVKQLVAADCVTNADNRVGVRVNAASTRGDVRTYRLVCRVGAGRTARPVSTGYALRTVYCRQGSLQIRTFGTPLRLRVVWFAPAAPGFTEYRKGQTYRT